MGSRRSISLLVSNRILIGGVLYHVSAAEIASESRLRT